MRGWTGRAPYGSSATRADDARREIALPLALFRELERLSLVHDRSVDELIRHAVEIHYSHAAVSARHRLVDRLARLEAELGDPDELHDQIVEDSRAMRSR